MSSIIRHTRGNLGRYQIPRVHDSFVGEGHFTDRWVFPLYLVERSGSSYRLYVAEYDSPADARTAQSYYRDSE